MKAVQYCRMRWISARHAWSTIWWHRNNLVESPVISVVKWSNRWHRPRHALARMDAWLIDFLQRRFNLLMALVLVGLCVWGLVSGFAWFVLGTAAVGALSYFMGLTVSLLCGIAFTGADIGLGVGMGANWSVSPILLQCVGYGCSAWLGFRHKQQQEQAKQRLLTSQDGHEPQVLPWAVVNEIRTSLAAVRFLLFPLHEEHTSQELKKATDELSRLEAIFTEIEQEEMQKKRR
ncbi:hypothetical protein [Alicyclobacillus kakegawensis]|uniref:hypothetical protein n=1 Tax=Alicyclobacillus kakegawensis TaxID=392012 RepID=UPI000A7BEBDD|nr:hypothetical protein [Alicyclobacillus kakegawensis]